MVTGAHLAFKYRLIVDGSYYQRREINEHQLSSSKSKNLRVDCDSIRPVIVAWSQTAFRWWLKGTA